MTDKWLGRIGKKYVDRLPETIIQVGSDQFTREELVVKAKSGNFYAAANLDSAINCFHPKSVREVARRVDQFMLRKYKGVGDTAIFVWCRIQKAKGVDVDAWLDKDLTELNRKKKNQ